MIKIFAPFILIVLCFIFNCNEPVKAPQQTQSSSTGPSTKIEIIGRALYLDDEKWLAKGVSYQPTPIGLGYGYAGLFTNPDVYNRDLTLLSDMGCNTIRTWAAIPQTNAGTFFLDACAEKGIYVIMGYWFDTNDALASPATFISEFRAYVNYHKNHNAVLMWAIGNEDNLEYMSPLQPSKLNELYGFIDDMAEAARNEENSSGHYHPTTFPNGGWTADGGIETIGISEYNTLDSQMIHLDIWGINSYWQNYPSFGTVFSTYEGKSSKPMIITEYGIDAWDNAGSTTYETTQASWTMQLWNEIEGSHDVCIGGCIMEYSDEWCKDTIADDNLAHDYGGGSRDDQPDEYSNEEWYGIMSIEDNGTNADIMHPRQVYYDLKTEWTQ